jgi:hypothetical protein
MPTLVNIVPSLSSTEREVATIGTFVEPERVKRSTKSQRLYPARACGELFGGGDPPQQTVSSMLGVSDGVTEPEQLLSPVQESGNV